MPVPLSEVHGKRGRFDFDSVQIHHGAVINDAAHSQSGAAGIAGKIKVREDVDWSDIPDAAQLLGSREVNFARHLPFTVWHRAPEPSRPARPGPAEQTPGCLD